MITSPAYRKKICLPILTIILGFSGFAQVDSPALLESLSNTISDAPKYDAKKIKEIDELSKRYRGIDKQKLFDHYLTLFEAYSLFNYDSAYRYAERLKATSLELNDASKVNYAKVKFNFILLSSGMFKEVFDSVTTISTSNFSNDQKAEYYVLMARCYFDVSDYDHDLFFSPRYNMQANKYLDSSLAIFTPESFEYKYYSGLKFIRAGNDEKAMSFFEKLMSDSLLTLHQIALTTSTFADIYFRKEQTGKITALLVQAAIADIQTSTKETSAIYHLANFLFKQGDVKNAAVFIQKAAADANFYGARHRMMQVSSILPVIAGKNLSNIEKEKKDIYRYALIITGLSAILLTLVSVIVRQVRTLKSQKREISIKNQSLQSLISEKDLLLEEKEWLRKEIHHRVKNNLHTVLSLLESQSAFLKNEALVANLDSQHRVYSMSLIHQKLYQTECVTSLDVAVYIPELVNYLNESLEHKQAIKFVQQVESILLNVAQAVAIGIIATEAITNCIKYAFPGRNQGIIEVTMKKIPGDTVQLSIADDGVGIHATTDMSKASSLGMRLMQGLSDDIHAQFRIESTGGTRITVTFKNDEQHDNKEII